MRVNSNKSSVALVIVLLCFFLLVLGMGLFGGIAYYKRKKGPAGWTKSSTNENYMDSVRNIPSLILRAASYLLTTVNGPMQLCSLDVLMRCMHFMD